MEEFRHGALYVVATPIGNRRDLSERARWALLQCPVIAAEDTRTARHLFPEGLPGKELISYFAPREKEKIARLLRALAGGRSVALISESGTPCISDPGYLLVDACHQAGIPVIPIPGPSAALAALSASGFPGDRFLFLGFLPRRGKERQEMIEAALAWRQATILYEAPGRLAATLAELAERAPARPAFWLREISKKFEESRRAPLQVLAQEQAAAAGRGEYVLILGPQAEEASSELSETEKERLQQLFKQSGSPRSAAQTFAEETGRPYRKAYKYLLKKS